MKEKPPSATGRAVAKPPRGEAAIAHFAALQAELFSDRMLQDSTPLIRSLREEDPTAWNGQ